MNRTAAEAVESLVSGVVPETVARLDELADHLVEFRQASLRKSALFEHLPNIGASSAVVGAGDIHEFLVVVPLVDDQLELPGFPDESEACLPIVAQLFELRPEGSRIIRKSSGLTVQFSNSKQKEFDISNSSD